MTLRNNTRLQIALLLLLSAGLLFAMWRVFWFLTDDAFISFRYVSNSLFGYGYVWNPPPFLPVEGYSNFLWVVLLDLVWRLFGVEPPVSSNWLSLIFSFGTLLFVTAMAMQMRWSERLRSYRTLLLGLALFGTLTNRTFLAWTSSGLETALFNFFVTFWLYTMIFVDSRKLLWPFWITLASSGASLTRPDGLLFWAVGVFIVGLDLGRQRTKWSLGRTLAAAPALLVPAHVLWRRSFYGEWLPNTYYAKITGIWPESGVRYFLSFVLEYALWIWLALLLFVVAKHGRSRVFPALLSISRLNQLLGVSTVVLHFAYYTLVVGGDHFEYRVYSQTIPLFFLSFLWLLNRDDFKPVGAATALSLFILLSYPLPWIHWWRTHELTTREETFRLKAPVAKSLPEFLVWYGRWFDDLQTWLIDRSVGMRHQEHKIFYEMLVDSFPSRETGLKIPAEGFPVYGTPTVGIAGWTLPRVNIIDVLGLNDYVIARNPVDLSRTVNTTNPDGLRQMAHDRRPPEGYEESFAPNVQPYGQNYWVLKRMVPMTAEVIIKNEARWRARTSMLLAAQKSR